MNELLRWEDVNGWMLAAIIVLMGLTNGHQPGLGASCYCNELETFWLRPRTPNSLNNSL